MNSYQKRTFMKRGPFDVDLTRIWIKASIKELKGKGLSLFYQESSLFCYSEGSNEPSVSRAWEGGMCSALSGFV